MRLQITDDDAGKRLDVFATEHVPELSRAMIQKLCEQRRVLVNGVAGKPSQKVKIADVIDIDFDPAELHEYPKIELPIIYEDDDCVVINKPLGLLSHSKGSFNPEATVATWMNKKYYATNSLLTGFNPVNNREGIVHRLDRATSGVMICAKTPEAHGWLQKQFAQRRTKKTYVAIVSGQLTPAEAIIDMPIERNPKKPQTFRVGLGGKTAQTAYRVMQENDNSSQLELKPTTGRTHQLRVHLKHIGHAIVGDTMYEGTQAERLYLHALSLELTLPSRERKVFTAELPPDFQQRMDRKA